MQVAETVETEIEMAPPKKRGRPRKLATTEELTGEAPKKRGRPRKLATTLGDQTPPKKRGRPRKLAAVVHAVDETPPKKRGRPRKLVATELTPKKRGRPRKNGDLSIDQGVKTQGKRGRPAAQFKIGDEVSWTSKAKGSRTKKSGKIVAMIPGGQTARSISLPKTAATAIPAFIDRPKRANSYLVMVGDILYRPRTKALKNLSTLN